MPIIKWLQYADHEMAPMCRSVTPGKLRTEEAVGYVLPTRDRALAPEAVGNHGMNLQAVNPPASPVSSTVSSCE
jgi:hypothetical protein